MSTSHFFLQAFARSIHVSVLKTHQGRIRRKARPGVKEGELKEELKEGFTLTRPVMTIIGTFVSEREKHGSLATLYGIILALDYLELRTYVTQPVVHLLGSKDGRLRDIRLHALDYHRNKRPCLN